MTEEGYDRGLQNYEWPGKARSSGLQRKSHKARSTTKTSGFLTQQAVDLWSSLSEDFLDAQNLHRLKRKLGKYLKKGVCFRSMVCLCGGCH